MTHCTIIISHFESLPFLHACIRQIRKYKHPAIEQHIIVADQSGNETAKQLWGAYGNDSDVTIAQMPPLYSGFGIDCIMRNIVIKPGYVCQLHVDAFPIHPNWLYLSIELLEEYNLYFVGQLQFYSRPTDTIYYLKNMFFAMAQCFNVARTETYKELSINAGFTRFHARKQAGFEYANDDWAKWAAADYATRGTDDDVVAFCWEDNHRQHNKLGLALTGLMGTGNEPGYGRIIEDIVFHFGFSRESVGVKEFMGDNYNRWTEKINAGFSDELIEEMLTIARANAPIPHPSGTHDRTFWNGISKTVSQPSNEINKRIEELKKL